VEVVKTDSAKRVE